MDWYVILGYVLLVAILFAGVFLTLLTLPGNWLMILAVAVYAKLTHWRILGWKVILLLVALGVAGEIVETVAGSRGAKKAGGTRRGGIGAFVGGVLGGILLTGLIPIPIVGTVVGILVGTFAGAVLFQLSGGQHTPADAAAVGLGAVHGRFIGMLVKIACAGVIFLVGVFSGFPREAAMVHPLPPTTHPTTHPATSRS